MPVEFESPDALRDSPGGRVGPPETSAARPLRDTRSEAVKRDVPAVIRHVKTRPAVTRITPYLIYHHETGRYEQDGPLPKKHSGGSDD
jgi:hypothetical protein